MKVKRCTVSKIGIGFLSLLILGASLLSTGSPASAQSPSSAPVQVVRSDSQGIVLEFHAPEYQLVETIVNGDACYQLGVEGWGQTDAAGWPQIPVQGAKLGLPPNAVPTVHVLDAQVTTVPLTLDLCPVPMPIVHSEPQLGEPGPANGYVEMAHAKDVRVYSTDTFYPAELAVLSKEGYLRDQRFVQLDLRPFQYNPARRELRVHYFAQLGISFDYAAGPESWSAGETDGPFEAVLAQSILNYDSARQWRHKSITPRQQAGIAWVPPVPAYKIAVDQDGLYRLTYADLAAAGVPVDALDPRTFQVFDNGQETTIYVTGEDDGQFNAGDEVFFYGQALDTRYTDTNVYWLIHGVANGLRMATRNGAPSDTAPVPSWFETTVHLEENAYYISSIPAVDGADHWYWNYLYPPGAPSQTYNVTLAQLAAESTTASLRAKFSGYMDQQHQVQVYVNGFMVADTTWSGKTEHTISADFSSTYLQAGNNTIQATAQVANGNSYDIVLVNWFELDYAHTYQAGGAQLAFDGEAAGTWQFEVGGLTAEAAGLYDVTVPSAPARILGYRTESAGETYTLTFEDTISGETAYLALTAAGALSPSSISADTPSNLQAQAKGADYVIISHGDFMDQAQQLANYRQGQSDTARTLAVDVQDIYDEFNDGAMDAEAIHSFLQYAYENWQAPGPSYVLLLGDGHYDFRNYTGQAPITRIPPFLFYMSDSDLGEAPADNRYVCLNGNDHLPEMHIGRLPADSVAEAQAMVDKTIAYETGQLPGDWIYDVLFTADDPSGTSDFYVLSDDIVDNYLPTTHNAIKVYLGDTCPYEDPAVTCRQAIVDTFNTGVLLSNYIGHGSRFMWAPEESLFRNDDIDALANPRLPVQLSFACNTGAFDYPSQTYDSIDEHIVAAADKGAVASWGNADYSYTYLDREVNEGFYEAVFQNDLPQLGPATTWAKLYYDGNVPNPLLLERKHLFGDPALTLAVDEVPTAVELARFEAMSQGLAVGVQWETATETGNLGFHLYRAESADGPWNRLNGDLIPSESPGAPIGANYEFVDESVAAETTYYYRLEDVDLYGRVTQHGPVVVETAPGASAKPYRVFLPSITRTP